MEIDGAGVVMGKIHKGKNHHKKITEMMGSICWQL